jgi:lysophospholipase L1-like esterase
LTVKKLHCLLLLTLLATAASIVSAANAVHVAPVSNLPAVKPLQANSPGRLLRAAGDDTYQWPGLYFDARFDGPSVFFRVGPGDVILRVLVDGEPAATLVKPAPGFYEIGDLARREHTVRIEAVTESQAAANVFGGFLYSKGTRPLPMPRRTRQIEFIGDSHTVGYGNTSTTRECSGDDVWKTTDNPQAFGPKMAHQYGADYQVNAISGRGVVRNYGGGAGDPLPDVYPFVLLDHTARFEDSKWRPQVIVVALGTNDFSTALNPQERWKSREELHADFEATYLRFLETLRAQNPGAFIVVWATDMAEGEIETEAGKAVARFQSAGEQRVVFVPIRGLAMTGCHWHPSVADDDTIATALMRSIDDHPDAWRTK